METKTKHTAGPWSVTEYPAGGCGINSTKYGVAYVFTSKDVCPNDPDEAEANARLIAAAPELLEACKMTETRLADWIKITERRSKRLAKPERQAESNARAYFAVLLQYLRAAIAKATQS